MSTGALAQRNCYNCKHHSVCSFYHDIKRVLDDHLGWVNVDMPSPPDWQRIYETLAQACLRYRFKKET